MIVVADTAPLNYLILIEHISVLEPLYGEVIIPPAVQDEMLAALAPAAVRLWMSNPPQWLEVRTPSRIPNLLHPKLDDGEREAICLVQAGGAGSTLLIDDLLGRQEATRLGLNIIGTLGVLLQAHQRGLLDIHSAIERLRTTNFNGTEALYKKFLDRT
jgi:predicted nucleic acid-binding protein